MTYRHRPPHSQVPPPQPGGRRRRLGHGVPRPVALWASEAVATALLLLAMTVLFRLLMHPGAWLHTHLASADARLLTGAVVSGAVVAALIASPLGRLSGSHANPAVTVAMWAVRRLPGRHVPFYLSAQLAGSVLGTMTGRLLLGPALAHPAVNHALLGARPGLPATMVAIGEAIATGVLLVVVIRLARHPGLTDVTPVTMGTLLTALIAVMANITGGSLNPARQFGPWLLAGGAGTLWPYIVGPLAAALFVGAVAAALPAPADGDDRPLS
ncbi:MIP/aquaporin family protein [Streptomyces sp. NPDC059866]|uniref:MIP/aquaporin family protein n=1 Tax=Streptomyces sp. NPDC059866 TaxID=3346978 RepID=UPI003658190F